MAPNLENITKKHPFCRRCKRKICASLLSLPPRGAWIEIIVKCTWSAFISSLPPRGAWIEITHTHTHTHTHSRSPHGERGLKYTQKVTKLCVWCRSPHGERGLKSSVEYTVPCISRSLPPRGAWIEISPAALRMLRRMGSLPPRGAWIEILKCLYYSIG